ncbi:hypothetical protein OsJ_18447 [Oryza sativa Japonica Group]|uniref:Uncharacterized protein n=1 Tax=Oryza sativa subsp. japonica TaxID=39947 RepID=B9FI39_ORYSJ|nr:hypothetical protein OsJ_18447 [Oryza sativa Japonica Group]
MAMFALATESARAAAAEDRRGADGIRRAEGSGGWRRRRDGHVARARCGAGEPDAGAGAGVLLRARRRRREGLRRCA